MRPRAVGEEERRMLLHNIVNLLQESRNLVLTQAMYVQRNTEACSCNHWCSGIAKYYILCVVCVCVCVCERERERERECVCVCVCVCVCLWERERECACARARACGIVWYNHTTTWPSEKLFAPAEANQSKMSHTPRKLETVRRPILGRNVTHSGKETSCSVSMRSISLVASSQARTCALNIWCQIRRLTVLYVDVSSAEERKCLDPLFCDDVSSDSYIVSIQAVLCKNNAKQIGRRRVDRWPFCSIALRRQAASFVWISCFRESHCFRISCSPILLRSIHFHVFNSVWQNFCGRSVVLQFPVCLLCPGGVATI